jgi:predicted TIM-barrel fold metal-dependent hydrolase
MRIAEVARDFPNLSVILGHSGVIEGVRDIL